MNLLKFLIVGIVMVVAFVGDVQIVSADAGQLRLCAITNGTMSDAVNDSTDYDGQTFATGTLGYNVGAIKLNLYDGTAGTVLDVQIVTIDGIAPDINTVFGTAQYPDAGNFPLSLGIPANTLFTCDLGTRSTQVVLFDPPIALAASTTFAVVVTYASGTTGADLYHWPLNTGDDLYSDGHAWECNDPISCTDTIPATWDLASGSPTDYAFAIFDDEPLTALPGTVDNEVIKLLETLDMNDPAGHIVFAGIFFFVGVLCLAVLKIPAIFSLIFMGILGAAVSIPGAIAIIPAGFAFSVGVVIISALAVSLFLNRQSANE